MWRVARSFQAFLVLTSTWFGFRLGTKRVQLSLQSPDDKGGPPPLLVGGSNLTPEVLPVPQAKLRHDDLAILGRLFVKSAEGGVSLPES